MSEGVFLREWRERSSGERRSLTRARDLSTRAGLDNVGIPIAAIVGSKGKGTAATYASAYLAASGLKVVTVTSPSYRSDRERIRVNGQAVTTDELADLSALLDEQIKTLPERSVHGGYLSPVGLYTLAGVMHARKIDADVLVLEAGRGGRSDEVSLFAPTVVGMTSIFAEHLGLIGRWIDEIAVDKAASVASTTRAVVSPPQAPGVWRTITATIGERTGGRIEPMIVAPLSSGIPVSLLAPGVNRANSELGIRLAQCLLDVTTHSRPDARDLVPTLRSVSLPGRLSHHPMPGTPTELLVDSAVTRAGVAATLTAALGRWGVIDHVLLCLPHRKDLDGVAAELAGLTVTFVRLTDTHLRFVRHLPANWDAVDSDELDLNALAGLGRRVVVLGTVYFIGRVLDLVNAETERLFSTPSGT